MKKFTSEDIQTWKSYEGKEYSKISCDRVDLIERPLDWQKQGLMETATGYGRKLTTPRMIHFNGRLRRVYCCQISNCGSCYILHKGEWLFIDAN